MSTIATEERTLPEWALTTEEFRLHAGFEDYSDDQAAYVIDTLVRLAIIAHHVEN